MKSLTLESDVVNSGGGKDAGGDEDDQDEVKKDPEGQVFVSPSKIE